ncbi:hypothetical protein QYE76_029882 [Lolium multiflorum]|uniref:Uncharacterized protein n=1 Tax=Lolium multiflorum TaxID=4521 RepID=A0AAD8QS34_LOLMU|nr:hypothetical protein QYE76_029882 [Lolium multiflorum]
MQAGRDESAHTVNAAAVVLAAAARSSAGLERHNHQHLQLHDHATAVPKRRWWWSWLPKPNLACFRPHGHPRRIANAGDTSPQPTSAHTASAAHVHDASHPPPPAFAFVAPPSSPASSLYASESPSPVLLGLRHASSPSPGRSSMMFAVGPYAEGPQQLVSPPVQYSAFTTEPSTAPRTPTTITNPSSPEVPFARFLGSSLSSSSMTVAGSGESGLFHAYQLQPGSPIPLVSPPGPSSPTRQLFRKKLHRRDEGSLLDGHIPVSTGGGGMDLVVPGTARDDDHGGEADDGDDEVPKSGEFVFGSADGPAEDMGGEARKNWHFFPMVEQDMIIPNH